MPYRSTRELPESVRDHLAEHAQEIYQCAYNSARDEYDKDETWARRVAWGAVARDDTKDDESGKWHRKQK